MQQMLFICVITSKQLKVEIMAQVSMTVRMDSQLKSMFDALCAEFGMSANTAMNVFAKAVVQQRCIPFIIKSSKMEDSPSYRALRAMAEAGTFPEMTKEEIDEEIRKARTERKRFEDA